MSAIRLLLSHHGSRAAAQLAIACIAALSCAAHSAGMTVLVADDVAAHAEFVHELRETQEPGSRFDLHLVDSDRHRPPGVTQRELDTVGTSCRYTIE